MPFFTLPVFDGGDQADEVLKTSNVIGKAQIAGQPLPGEDAEAAARIMGESTWPVTIGYFGKSDSESSEELPVYEVSFLLYENGVSRKLNLRYPDYSLNAHLVSLEFLEETRCEPVR